MANLGYIKIDTRQKSQNEKEYYLLTDKNSMDKVMSIELANDVPNLRSINDLKKLKNAILPQPRYKLPQKHYVKDLIQKIVTLIES